MGWADRRACAGAGAGVHARAPASLAEALPPLLRALGEGKLLDET